MLAGRKKIGIYCGLTGDLMGQRVRGIAKAAVIGLIFPACFAGSALATEGYFQNGYGARQAGLAGAGVADSRDAMALSLNPAGIVGIGQQFQMGLSIFMPYRGYEATGTMFVAPGDIESSSNIFGVPNMAYVRQIDPMSAWGIALFGNGGMNTTYRNVTNTSFFCPGAPGVFCAGATGVDLMQAFITLGYARSFGQFSVGVAPVVAIQRFKAKGLAAFNVPGASIDPTAFTNTGYDYSFGAGVRAGIQWNLTGNVRLGVSGQTPIWMTEFDKYRGLFAEQGDFDIPGNITAGIAFDLNPAFTVMFDYKRIFYGSVASIANPMASPGQFGADNGPGFGWHDVNIFKVGAEWRPSPLWTLRIGYAHNDNPIKSPDVMFNILAPGVVTDHFTGGFSYQISPNSKIDFAATYVPEHSVSGPEFTPFGATPGSNITLSMHQYQFTLGWTYQFDAPRPAALITK